MGNFSNLKKIKADKLILLGSIFCLLYFTALTILSNYNLNIIVLGALIELFTIPLILLLLFLTVFSLHKNFKNRFKIKSSYIISTIISLITIIILVISTI
jgi:hypothetical protein